MCLTLLVPNVKNRKGAIKVAMKTCNSTITVYKVLRDDLHAPIKYFQYELEMHYYNVGKDKFTYQQSFPLTKYFKLRINAGLYAFTSLKKAQSSYLNRYGDKIIVKCIIPKGSKYFIDRKKGEIVSDNLILKEIVK